jgi:Ni,Fe-hydrogenase III large subunit
VPGGVAADLSSAGIDCHPCAVARDSPRVSQPWCSSTIAPPRCRIAPVATGRSARRLARQFGAGGFVGRASDRAFDARQLQGPLPYGELGFGIVTRTDGDVNARVWVRIDEVTQSLALIERILERLPSGNTQIALPTAHEAREGMAIVEGFRGDILVWLRLGADGRIARCHLRDPSWFQWPLLEAVIEGNIVADFPLCNKSFNCSYSGHDL